MRTALTMLGMIIGVARGHHDGGPGHRRPVVHRRADSNAGHQYHHVQAGNFTQGGVRQGQGNASTLTPDDAAEIAKLPGRALYPRPRSKRAGRWSPAT